MAVANINKPDRQIVADALSKAADCMGLTRADLADILLIDQSTLGRSFKTGIDPDSLKGQASLFVIKIYRSLFAFAGNNKDFMHHFLYTNNNYFDARPVDEMKRLEGLVRVSDFLNAMSGKV